MIISLEGGWIFTVVWKESTQREVFRRLGQVTVWGTSRSLKVPVLFKVTTMTDVTFKAPVPDHSDCRLKWTIWSPPGQYPGFLIIAIYNVPTNFPSYIFTSPTSNIPANAILFRASHMQQHWDQTNKAFQVLNIVNAGTTPSSC